jgi:ATP-binding cassette subfamily B (MDR/TAP) protein 1
MAPPLAAISEARAAVAAILETIQRKPLIDGLSDQGLKPEQHLSGEIILRDVNFAYPMRPKILVCRDYQLTVNPGETVALVGPSGCGKSTIINLLLRFYDPISGSISVDGYDIKGLNLRWLRSQIGYVGQEPILFAGTIAENIAYGLHPDSASSALLSSKKLSSKKGENPHDASDELMNQVIQAAKLANAHQFISALPDGYHTNVGANGVAMSGGKNSFDF